MAASRPRAALALSTSASRLKVRARSSCTSRSPTPDGHSSSEDLSSARRTDAETGWPRSARSSAGATTCLKLIVPYRSSAVSQASAAAGTTVLRMPIGISPPALRWKYSIEAARGQRPSPLIVTTESDSAR